MRVSFLLPIALIAAPALAAGQSTPPAASPTGAKTASAADPNKVRCKREETTGSLAGGKRVCHTEAEWQAMSDQAREQAKFYQGVAAQGGSGH